MRTPKQKTIEVWAGWAGMAAPSLLGHLYASPGRGKEIFSFSYDPAWLKSEHSQMLDPDLQLYSGIQYARDGHDNFGLFLDSSPDRWGRVLMQRREAHLAAQENRPARPLWESDYLLGVFDGQRMGALRFRLEPGGSFLDDQTTMAAPPWTKLKELAYVCHQLESDNAEDKPDYHKWLEMLIAPGSSLGGARPKAGVIDDQGHPWIAKFPSRRDEINVGKWEYLVHLLAQEAGLKLPQAQALKFWGEHDTFLAKRFDRSEQGERVHFASAMTLLGKKDGDNFEAGVSYLDLAEFIIRYGAKVDEDLEELWRRLVFYLCVSNTDDHLRNHGFLLTPRGWQLSPGYDINATSRGGGLSLNITQEDNRLDLDLAREIAPFYRLERERAEAIILEVKRSVQQWQDTAAKLSIPPREVNLMRNAFALSAD